MTERLIDCVRCKSNACTEYSEGETKVWICFGCGFGSTSVPKDENYEASLPELYRDLKFIDDNGNIWFPITYNEPTQGLVFADGKNKDDWKWSAAKAVKLKPEELFIFPPGTKYKMNMETLKQFEQNDFMEALDFVGYFKNKKI